MPRCLHSLARPSLCALLLCCAAALFIAAPRASAQGTMGLLPGPITTHELDGYARRLDLSPQQRRSLDAMHDQYKQEMRVLREGEIAEFLTKMRDMDRGGAMPERKAIEDFMQRMEALNRKIAAVDNRLFDQLQTALTEPQLAMLQRAKQARTRARMNSSQMMWMGGGRPVDLSVVLLDVEATSAERTNADPILSQYESKLTSDMEKMQGSQYQMILDMFDALERMGFSEADMQDPEKAGKMAEAMQQVWKDMMSKSMETAAELAKLNDRTAQSVVAVLTPETGRAFRTQYWREAYPEVSVALSYADYLFTPALARDDLTPEQREAVTTIRDELRRKLDAIATDGIAVVKANRIASSPFEYDAQAAEAYQKSIAELTAKVEEARAAANTSLEAALGKDLLDKIGRIKPAQEELAEGAQTIAVGGGMEATIEIPEESEEELEPDIAWGIDQFVPPAIGEPELAEYGVRFTLTDEQNTVVRELFVRYSEAFNQLGAAEFARLQAAQSAMWRYDETTQTTSGPTTDAINDVYRLRSAAIEAIKRVDESFFSELELAVLTEEQAKALPRVRLGRDRVIFNRGAYYWGSGGSNEASLDVSRIVTRRRTSVPAENWTQIDALLATYEQKVGPLFRNRYEKSLEAQKVQEQWSAEMTRAQAEGDQNAVKLGMRYQEMMKGPQQALADASFAIATLNRETIDAVVQLMASEAGSSLRSEFNRRAFPNVYSDAGALDHSLTRAIALPGLTEEQQRRLADLAAEYHPAYAALCDQMVKASEGDSRNGYFAGMDADDINEWQKREEIMSKLRFDRSELSARAGRTLSDILSEDQLKSIGGLPVAEESNGFD